MEWQWLQCLVLILSFSVLPHSKSENTITATNSITSNQTIISAGGTFALGFFSPGNSTGSYLGIWYNTIPKLTVIWVANRASPVPKGSPSILRLSKDGNLVVLSGKEQIWTSNVSVINATDAVLLDNGNLVLRHGKDELWHSFDHLTDMFLTDMKLSSTRSGQEMRLTSWVDDENPQPGIFSLGIDPHRHQVYIWKGDEPYWRSNIYATNLSYGSGFIGDGKFGSRVMDGGFPAYISYVVKDDEDYLLYGISINSISTRFTLVPHGQIELHVWMQNTWKVVWKLPRDTCDFYGYCGSFTICSKTNESIPACKCMTGFQPKSYNEWSAGNWTGGCVRIKTLSCNRGDMFSVYERVKLPDHAVSIGKMSFNDCESGCFSNCSCTAYAYENVTNELTIICLNWFRDLVDISNNNTFGQNLYVRVHSSQLVDKRHENTFTLKKKIRNEVAVAVAVAIVSVGLLLICIFGYFLTRRRRRMIKEERIRRELLGYDSMSTSIADAHNSVELVSFSLRCVVEATGSFSVENKLGEGGFGSVYKGSLPGNIEVAVKRLSARSSQGREEFMNELRIIAKLQQTNLVRLLGCCVEEDEKILLYEYMPNRSLDKFLFDPSESLNLDWSNRFNIIEGIAQGLLYLHKYSRLTVIHRDLKASNHVLLDQMMTPKISDFGLARIFGMNQTQDKTNRVVGTYGYMAPEYALHGWFSERSDVFSFGVLLLEIVTGKRSTSNYIEGFLTILEWAWKRWIEGRGLELIDPLIRSTCSNVDQQVVKCINVVMLINENATVPSPKKPAFTLQRSAHASSRFSNNEVTVTNLEPR